QRTVLRLPVACPRRRAVLPGVWRGTPPAQRIAVRQLRYSGIHRHRRCYSLLGWARVTGVQQWTDIGSKPKLAVFLNSGQAQDSVERKGGDAKGPQTRQPRRIHNESEQHRKAQRTESIPLNGLAPMSLGESEQGAREAAKRAILAGQPVESAQTEA